MRRRGTVLDTLTSAMRRAAATVSEAVAARRGALASLGPRVVRLDEVRRRLELLVTAVYDQPIPIAATEKPRSRAWWVWMEPFAPGHLRRTHELPTTDGERIQLPREIVAADADAALAQYRLMAVEQAERIIRGTTTRLAETATPAERDLYLLREAQIVDAAIVRTVPGLRTTLAAARSRALNSRPPRSALTKAEQVVEDLVCASLAADLTRAPRQEALAAVASSPDDSLAWARQKVQELGGVRGRYRGIAPVAAWGTVRTTSRLAHERLEQADELATMKGTKHGVGKFGRGAGKGGRQASETGSKEGTSEATTGGKIVLHEDGPRRVESHRNGRCIRWHGHRMPTSPSCRTTSRHRRLPRMRRRCLQGSARAGVVAPATFRFPGRPATASSTPSGTGKRVTIASMAPSCDRASPT